MMVPARVVLARAARSLRHLTLWMHSGNTHGRWRGMAHGGRGLRLTRICGCTPCIDIRNGRSRQAAQATIPRRTKQQVQPLP
jgi:hypothetical protein